MADTALKRVIVTGGNAGIGYALCKQLIVKHGCSVYLGARNESRGKAAIEGLIKEDAMCEGKVELVNVDVSDPTSIRIASEDVAERLGNEKLYGLVNNAGVIHLNGVTKLQCMFTNVYGPKWMSEAFIPLIDPSVGRIVNLGSGSGPLYVKSLKD